MSENTLYAKALLGRAAKLGERALYYTGDGFIDWPHESTKARETARKYPRGLVGVYNKSAGLQWVLDDMETVCPKK
jgi:hypothetical protein